MNVYAYDYVTFYDIIATDGSEDNTYDYQFDKSQDVSKSADEATLLAQAAIDAKSITPTVVSL